MAPSLFCRAPRIQDEPANALVLQQREDLVALELVAPVQELELDDERQPDHLAAELLDEVDRRLRGAAGREHVVVDQHPLAGDDRVGVHLERVEAVLERVLGRHRSPGELARLTRGDEPAAEPAGEGAAGDVTPSLRPEHEVGLLRLGPLRDPLHRLPERLAVGEQGHDVLEDDSRLREVRDVADLRGEVDRHQTPATRRRSARQKRSCESSWASSASPWRSSSAPWRASGLRERSFGNSASRRSAWFPAAVANLRSCRTSTPAATSRAQTTAVSTSLSPKGGSSRPYSTRSRPC